MNRTSKHTGICVCVCIYWMKFKIIQHDSSVSFLGVHRNACFKGDIHQGAVGLGLPFGMMDSITLVQRPEILRSPQNTITYF